MFNEHKFMDYATEIIAVSSVIHTFLPPYDWDPDFVREGMADFPEAQKIFHACFNNRWYKLLVYVVGYVAVNFRSTIWQKFISVNKQVQKAKDDTVAEMGGTTTVTASVVEVTTVPKSIAP